MGSGGSEDPTTVNTDPWSAQQPYLKRGFDKSGDLLAKGGPKYFTGQNYTNYSTQTNKAQDALWDRGREGSPIMGSASGLVQNTLNGDYLSPDSNPYLRDYYDQAIQGALPSLNATFAGAGRTGAEAQTQAMGDMYGAVSRDVYGGAYEAERGRQMEALQFAPQIAANDYTDIQAMMTAGDMKDAKSKEKLNARMDRFNFNQQRPYNNLQQYMQNIQGSYGGQQTSPTYGGNTAAGMLGGAAAGGALGTEIYPGWGTAIGAIGGGLLGAFQ